MSRNYKGEIRLYLGGMFAKKTSKLLEDYREFGIKKKKRLIIKYEKDMRYTKTGLSTHDLIVQKEDVISSGNTLSSVYDKCTGCDFVGIDEGQFYKDLPEFAEKLANLGIVVSIASLDGNFNREQFGRTLELIPKAEIVVKLHGVCGVCLEREASFSKLKKEIAEKSDGSQELIGGSETYIAVCRECYFKKD